MFGLLPKGDIFILHLKTAAREIMLRAFPKSRKWYRLLVFSSPFLAGMILNALSKGDKNDVPSPLNILKLPGRIVEAAIDTVDKPLTAITDAITPEGKHNVLGDVLKIPGKVAGAMVDAVEAPVDAVSSILKPGGDGPLQMLKVPGKVVDDVQTPIVGVTDTLTAESSPNMRGEMVKVVGKIGDAVCDNQAPIHVIQGNHTPGEGTMKAKEEPIISTNKNEAPLVSIINAYYSIRNGFRRFERLLFSLLLKFLFMFGLILGAINLEETIKTSVPGQIIWRSIQDTPLIVKKYGTSVGGSALTEKDVKPKKKRPLLGGIGPFNPVSAALNVLIPGSANTATLSHGKSAGNTPKGRLGLMGYLPLVRIFQTIMSAVLGIKDIIETICAPFMNFFNFVKEIMLALKNIVLLPLKVINSEI